jgi:hypothetical protein
MGLWHVKDPTFSRHSAHRWLWVCQPYEPATLYLEGRFLVLISVNTPAIVKLEGLGKLKKITTSSGTEAAIFRFVTQCLNNYTTGYHCLKSKLFVKNRFFILLNVYWGKHNNIACKVSIYTFGMRGEETFNLIKGRFAEWRDRAKVSLRHFV